MCKWYPNLIPTPNAIAISEIPLVLALTLASARPLIAALTLTLALALISNPLNTIDTPDKNLFFLSAGDARLFELLTARQVDLCVVVGERAWRVQRVWRRHGSRHRQQLDSCTLPPHTNIHTRSKGRSKGHLQAGTDSLA